MSSNTRYSGLSRQRGYSASHMASAFSGSSPIKNVWDAFGRQVAGQYPPTNTNTLICALTEELDKLPQQLLDSVVQSMVRRVNVASHSTVHISRTDTFSLRVPADF
ncbi:hypothetical protein TNCV_2382601 [Trichonephila clavipes]|nr:hypothetical protein TNCV_2382601 [Trichonephila clavipes]